MHLTAIKLRGFKSFPDPTEVRLEPGVAVVDGPPHERRFVCAALIDGERLGTGSGTTKKDAEQEAARMALDRLGLPRH